VWLFRIQLAEKIWIRFQIQQDSNSPEKGKIEEILCFEELVVVSGVLEAVHEKIFTVVKQIF
jgi:hypothetical protein